MSLCRTVWPNSQPPWQTPAIAARYQRVNRADYQPPTRAELGLTTLPSAEEIQGLIATAEDLRDETRDVCCRGAHPSVQSLCRERFQAIRIQHCPPSRDMNTRNNCNVPGHGTYDVSPNRGLCDLWSSLTQQQKDEFWQLGVRFDMRELCQNARRPGVLIFGSILAHSHYSIQGDFNPRQNFERMIRHELGHACSNILSDVSVHAPATPEQRRVLMFDYIQGLVDGGACGARIVGHGTVHQQALQGLMGAEESRAVSACLQNLTQASTQILETFGVAACQGLQLEEATAQAFAVYQSRLSQIEDLRLLCAGGPSGQHPSSAHVLECLINRSPSFRARLRQEANCND